MVFNVCLNKHYKNTSKCLEIEIKSNLSLKIKMYFQECPDIALDAVVELIHKLSPHQKTEVIRTLSQLELETEQSSTENLAHSQ